MKQHKKITSVVTGANGFIGSHLVDKLHALGHDVYTLPHTFGEQQIKDFFEEKRPNYIFHLAAYGNMSTQKSEDEIMRGNIDFLYYVLQGSKAIPYSAFVYVSSSSVTRPHHTLYAATKIAGEALCRSFYQEYKKPIVSVRPYSVYGPGEADFRFIPTIIKCLVKDEELTLAPDPSHDWVYIDDVVNEIWNIAYYLPMVEQSVGFDKAYAVHELGTGLCMSNSDIVDLLEQISGKKARLKIVDQLRRFDTDKWFASKGLATSTSLIEGLLTTYNWYKEKYEEQRA